MAVTEERPTVADLADITAVILVGGLGTRLRSVVADRPKSLAEVRGQPFLAYVLDELNDAGVRRVVLCTGHLGERMRSEFGDAYGGMELTYSQEATRLGTAGALRLALPSLRTDPVLVMNGDSFCDADLGMLRQWHGTRPPACPIRRTADRRASGHATLLLAEAPDTRRFGRVVVDDEGRVVAFEEKKGQRGPGWINAGVYLLDRNLIREIPAGREVSLEREIFPAWIGRGLYGYQSEGRFLDIGTPESFAMAEEFFMQDALV